MQKMFYFYKFKGKISPLQSQAGMSLLEMAIGLVVVGLIVVPIMKMYQHDYIEKAYETNLGALNESLDGVNQFFISGNGFYPCPTDLSLTQGDNDFGASGDCTLTNVKLCSNPTWFTSGGICKTSDLASSVIIGGLPFADLKMSNEEALDFWGNKLIYAVSHRQSALATYTYNGAAISIMSVDNPVLVAAGPASNPDRDGIPDIWPDAQDIYIFSTGENGIGGYTHQGNRLSPSLCNDTLTYENENCDFDNIFFALKGPEDTEFGAYSKGNNAQQYDDMTVYQQALPLATWYQDSKNPLYVDKDFVLTQATKVAIATSDNNPSSPYSEVNLKVDGAIRSDVIPATGEGGHLRSDEYCDTDGPSFNCLDPKYVTDAEDSMNCIEGGSYTNEVTRGVMSVYGSAATSSVGCSTGTNASSGVRLQVDNSKFGVVDCQATGMVAMGVNASGDMICISIP